MMDRWTEYELFVKVAELGSVTKAADALDLSSAAASRHLAAASIDLISFRNSAETGLRGFPS